MENIDLNEHSLAYELLVELKHSAKRWFIAFLVMCVLEVGTIIGFLYYISLPIEEYHIEQEADNGSFNNVSNQGEVNNGSTTESELQEKGNQK